ncbi:MAG TPA: DUF1345 domain-containing protein [Steroidobacteraceae bacterium]|nr:DUF1345 domain-containing protein [Steroidobacteraceae bacterium]
MARQLNTFLSQIWSRPRLLIALGFAICIAILLPSHYASTTRVLAAWDSGAMLYLILALMMFAGATPQHMRSRARNLDDGAVAVLIVTIAAAVISLFAIILELSSAKSLAPDQKILHFVFGIFTLICSWIFVHTSFALHYAHEFYIDNSPACLSFPNTTEPDYWDFMYFGFVIGMTSQTSDVAIGSRRVRRLVLSHGVVAFFFNAALLALAINAAASTL